MTTKRCAACGKEFVWQERAQRYCSPECKVRRAKERRKRGPVFTHCKTCGVELVKDRNRRYCSQECQARGGVHVACAACGKPIRLYPSRFNQQRKYGRAYCSWVCRSQFYKGPRNPAWKGRWVNHHGYVVLRGALVPEPFKMMTRKGDSVLEHRLVMAQHLGRPLESWEVVHHKNGVKTDNRIENLELLRPHAHIGVTNSDRREVRELKREIARLEQHLAELEQRLAELSKGGHNVGPN